MSDKLAAILVGADRKVLEMGPTYAKNVVARGWMSDQRLHFFGPAEVTIATDPDPKAIVSEIIERGTVPHACKRCLDKYAVSGMLEELGRVVEYIGEPVSVAIKEGHAPMTW